MQLPLQRLVELPLREEISGSTQKGKAFRVQALVRINNSTLCIPVSKASFRRDHLRVKAVSHVDSRKAKSQRLCKTVVATVLPAAGNRVLRRPGKDFSLFSVPVRAQSDPLLREICMRQLARCAGFHLLHRASLSAEARAGSKQIEMSTSGLVRSFIDQCSSFGSQSCFGRRGINANDVFFSEFPKNETIWHPEARSGPVGDRKK
jgi:hypothetical protein